jgi:uncharacterized membrane protein YkvA (DUF1232 family)
MALQGETAMNLQESRQLDVPAFWRHVRRFMRFVPFMKDLLAMFYASQDPKTPMWVKGMIAAALAYFALPIDAIPDVLFIGLGFTDDAAVVVATLKAVSSHVTEDHRRQAEDWLAQNA